MIDLIETLGRQQIIFLISFRGIISIDEKIHHKVFLSKSIEGLLSFYLYLHF